MKRLAQLFILAILLSVARADAQLQWPPQAYHYVTGAVGVLFKIYPNSQTNPPPVPFNLLGSTTDSLVCVPIPPTTGSRQVLSLTPSSDGTYATRTSQASDFPSAGEYNCELVASWGSGPNVPNIPSPPFNFFVAPAL